MEFSPWSASIYSIQSPYAVLHCLQKSGPSPRSAVPKAIRSQSLAPGACPILMSTIKIMQIKKHNAHNGYTEIVSMSPMRKGPHNVDISGCLVQSVKTACTNEEKHWSHQ